MASTFSGFPQQGVDFLANLASHNERAWFEAHKAEYQKYLLEPALTFVSELGSKLQAISSGIRTDPRSDGSGVLMRIHRDTRFSKDKSPYKTNISGLFWEGQKKTESPAFGFQLEATGMGLMAGIFKFSPEMLNAYRNAVLDERTGRELTEVLESLQKAGVYQIGGEHYKRVPAGFDPTHKRADLLRYVGLYLFSPGIPISAVQTPALVDICYAHFQKMAPIFLWLTKGVKTGA
jgi:uncharacterized protein (TIGR02453 family)